MVYRFSPESLQALPNDAVIFANTRGFESMIRAILLTGDAP